MTSVEDIRFIDKVTKQTYRLLQVGNGSVLLEGNNSLQIWIPISALNAHYELEFLESAHTESPSR